MYTRVDGNFDLTGDGRSLRILVVAQNSVSDVYESLIMIK